LGEIGVSVFCPTYQRCPYPLEELVYCFLNQDYKKKELLIYNDDPDVRIRFEHPDVHIMNRRKRHNNYYEKVNLGRQHCKYDIIMNWADDDLYFPHALSTAVKYFKRKKKPMLTFTPHYKASPRECNIEKQIIPGLMISTKEAWEECGGYDFNSMDEKTLTRVAGNDKGIVKKAKELGLYTEAKLKDDEVFFVWRFSLNYPWKRSNWSDKDQSKFITKLRKPEEVVLEPKRGKYAIGSF